jgi:membrane protein YqaA with SNARE-associated domain
MRLFGPLYDRALVWSGHRHAPRYLAALSFAESSFFPVPPDVMLIPMSAARPRRWAMLALITTAASVLGGAAGYLIGYLALDLVEPLIEKAGYLHRFEQAQTWFATWGVWVVFVAGFSPIPYKLFTLSAGALAMAFVPFLLASFVGRGARFFLVALLVSWLGPRVEPTVRRYIEWLGWATVALLLVAVLWYQLRS